MELASCATDTIAKKENNNKKETVINFIKVG
jgi:hypothetical protein